jgi:hypothetical protein
LYDFLVDELGNPWDYIDTSPYEHPKPGEHIVQLWTGAVDFVGKKIFEGDILECPRREVHKFQDVYWNPRTYQYYVDNRQLVDFLQHNEVVVRGNIFQNKDLLET